MDGGVASERCLFGAIVYEVAIVGKLMRDVEIWFAGTFWGGSPPEIGQYLHGGTKADDKLAVESLPFQQLVENKVMCLKNKGYSLNWRKVIQLAKFVKEISSRFGG